MRVREIEMTSEELALSGRLALSSLCVLPYRQLDRDKIEIYCYSCMHKEIVSYKRLKEIQYSRCCPNCFRRFWKTTKKTKGNIIKYICKDNLGYCIDVEYDFDDVRVLRHEQMADYEAMLINGRKTIAIKKGYYLNTSGYFYRWDFKIDGSYINRGNSYNNWKYRSNVLSYYDETFDTINRKKLYQDNCAFITKSNQIKLAIDNNLTPIQCKLVKVFNLNNYNDVSKYSHLLGRDNFRSHLDDFITSNIELNIFYLDYINRTKIDLGKYYHYLQNLNALGWKYDKPKKEDFEYRLANSVRMVQEKKDKEINKRITKRYNSLPKYKSGDVVISPFDNADAIRNSGKQLHNCIGGYVDKYSKGQCDLYYMNIKGKLVINMEVRDNRLIQARTDKNGDCTKKQQTHIVNFCNANNIEHFYNI